MSGLDLRAYRALEGSTQQKIAIAQRLYAAILEARSTGQAEELEQLEALAAEMEPALWELDREINQARNRLADDVIRVANAVVVDEIRRLQNRKARRMKRSWRR